MAHRERAPNLQPHVGPVEPMNFFMEYLIMFFFSSFFHSLRLELVQMACGIPFSFFRWQHTPRYLCFLTISFLFTSHVFPPILVLSLFRYLGLDFNCPRRCICVAPVSYPPTLLIMSRPSFTHFIASLPEPSPSTVIDGIHTPTIRRLYWREGCACGN